MDIMLTDMSVILDTSASKPPFMDETQEQITDSFVMMFANVFEELSRQVNIDNKADPSRKTPLDDIVENTTTDNPKPQIETKSDITEPTNMDIQQENEPSIDMIQLAPVVAWLSFSMPKQESIENTETEPTINNNIAKDIPKEVKNKLSLAAPDVKEIPKEPAHQEIPIIHKSAEIAQEFKPLTAKVAEQTDSILIPSDASNSTDDVIHTQNINQTTSTPPQLGTSKNIHINTPVHQQAKWTEDFSQHIAWLGKQSIKSAMIHLNPKDLGPISLMISVTDDIAKLSIQTQHQQVRDMITDSLPKLKDMMLEQGVNLSDVQFDNQSRQSSSQSHQQERFIPEWANQEQELLDENKDVIIKKGLVDDFA